MCVTIKKSEWVSQESEKGMGFKPALKSVVFTVIMVGNYSLNLPKFKGRDNSDDWAAAVENFSILEGIEITKSEKNGNDDQSISICIYRE